MKEKMQLKDVISPQEMNLIDKRDKEIMVTAMKRLIEDLNNIEIVFAGMELKPDYLLRLHQFINTNRLRARKVIWGLTISRIKDSNEKEYLEDIEKAKEILNTDEKL